MDKASETLTTRIREAEESISSLEARLADMREEKRALLASPTINTKELARIEAEEAKIPATIASLHTRCDLLAGQLETAEKAEAEQRIAAIEREYTALALTLKEQHDAWLAGLEALAKLLAETTPVKEKLKCLQEEAAFLVEKYGTAWPHLPTVSSPSRDDITRALEEGFRKSSWFLHANSRWTEKTAELRKQKTDLAHAEAEKKRRAARSHDMVKMFTPPFIAGPTPKA